MNTKKYFISLVCLLLGTTTLWGQNVEVSIEKTLRSNEILLSFSKEEGKSISSISVSGTIRFTAPKGNVRILSVNEHGFEKMIYESFPLLATNDVDHFEHMAWETFNLKDFDPQEIHLQLENAEIFNLTLNIGGLGNLRSSTSTLKKKYTYSLQLRDAGEYRAALIQRMNIDLARRGELWRAGDTPFSRLSYEEKKTLFGGVVPNLQGAEYYIGGIIDISGQSRDNAPRENSAYTPDFDWRARHSANIKGSPYFQHEVTGWITPVKDQAGCGSCWAFSAAGAVEAVAKLYKNATYNLNLSEQELVSCSNAGNCTGGFASSALDYIRGYYLQDENSFKYKAKDLPCSDKKPYAYRVKIAGKELFNPTGNAHADMEKLKSMLVKSPLAGRVGEWRHAMTLVGYKTIREGDVIYPHYTTAIKIKPGDPRIGKTVWIFKNSWGESWGDHGFLYAFVDISNMRNSATPSYPVSCQLRGYAYHMPQSFYNLFSTFPSAYDKDNDGYYWWGIGPRPKNLPPNAKLEEDSDDSDASIGPMDQYGYPQVLKKYDLFIKDNSEDRGFEPNITIKNGDFWSAPEVWVRHENDDVEMHQNPIPNAENYIKVRVWNRGTQVSKPSTVVAYWSKAGTHLPWPGAWTGEDLEEGLTMGARVTDVGRIPPINPGESKIITIKWRTPDPEQYANLENEQIGGDNLWHFCLLLRITDRNDPDTYPLTPTSHVNVINNNNLAQKNVTFVKLGNSGYQGTVGMYNHLSEHKKYSLDIVELLEDNQTSIFEQAKVSLKMSPKVLNAWTKGGKKGEYLRSTEIPSVVEYTSSSGVLKDMIFNPKEYSLVNLKVNFTSVLPWYSQPEKRTLLLRQIDEKGVIVGGETFVIIRNPRTVIIPHIEQERQGSKLILTARGVGEDAEYHWFDSKGNFVGQGETLSCNPYSKETYKVEVIAKSDGYCTYSETMVEPNEMNSRLQVIPNPVRSRLTLSYRLPTEETYFLHIRGLDDTYIFRRELVDGHHQEKSIDVSDLLQGGYVISILDKNGQLVATAKFFKE